MKEFINKTSLVVLNLSELKEAFPNIFIPDNPSNDYLDQLDYAEIYHSQPEFDSSKKANRIGQELIEGIWFEKWEVVDKPEEERLVDLALAKRIKDLEINENRLKINYTSFVFQGKAIACDALSRSDIDGTNGFISLNGIIPPGWPGGWKAIDNTYVSIPDVATWKSFYNSIFATGNSNFAYSQTLKAAVAAATTIEELEAIKW